MSDEQAEKIGQCLRDRYEEVVAAEVAELLVQGFALEQIEVRAPTVSIRTILTERKLTVTCHIVGRKPATDDA